MVRAGGGQLWREIAFDSYYYESHNSPLDRGTLRSESCIRPRDDVDDDGPGWATGAAPDDRAAEPAWGATRHRRSVGEDDAKEAS